MAVAMKIKSTFPAAAVLTLLLAAGSAAAQSGGVSSTLAADFEVRIQRLERELLEMNGKHEEAQYEIRQLRDRLERMTGDLEFRLDALEAGGKGRAAPPPPAQAAQRPPAAGGTLGAPQTTPPPAPQPPASQPPRAAAPAPTPSDPVKAYEQAFGYLREANYDVAEKALADFLARHGAHTLAGNAQYWLGEAYYARGKFTEAAVAFATGAQKYPKGAKGPDNLLKLGMALGKINKKTEACTALSQLPQKYPEASASVKKRAEGERRVLKCPGA